MNEDKYLLKHSRTNKYITMPNETKPSEFTLNQIKVRMGCSVNHKKAFYTRLENSGYVMEKIGGNADGGMELIINSEISYSEDDLLTCDAIYHFEREVIKKRITYCKFRGSLKIPPKAKGELIKVELNVLKITGKIVK